MSRKTEPGDILLALLILLPLAAAGPRLWALQGSGAVWLLSLAGRIAGVLGLATLLVTAALCVRLPALDRWFGGLPRLWLLHRRLGFAAFILILVHALLLTFATLPFSTTQAVRTLFPPFPFAPIWAGWLALLALTVAIAPTFQVFAGFHYQRWKRQHLLAAAALVLALLHALPLLAESAVWWGLSLLAGAAIAWRKLLAPVLARHEYQVTQVTQLAADVVEICLRPQQAGITHAAGQFVYLTPEDESLSAGRGEEHPYTVTSAPGDAELKVGIKALGDASLALQSLTPGSRVRVEGPYGQFFTARAPQRKQLWLGGGIGITPFVSAARQLAQQPERFAPVTLFYLANREARAYYHEELEQIAEANPQLTVVIHYFSCCGPLTEAFLREHCADFAERELFICGPPAMLSYLRGMLAKAGVDPHLIHTEAFDFL
jgi:predicted ferric reductase